MSDIKTHDDYIAATPEQFQPLLNDLRATLAETLPEAQEIVAYNMPGFAVGTWIVAGYAAFTKQCGLYVSGEAIKACAEELAELKFKPTKTGVKFTPEKPLPRDLVVKLARLSLAEAKAD